MNIRLHSRLSSGLVATLLASLLLGLFMFVAAPAALAGFDIDFEDGSAGGTIGSYKNLDFGTDWHWLCCDVTQATASGHTLNGKIAGQLNGGITTGTILVLLPKTHTFAVSISSIGATTVSVYDSNNALLDSRNFTGVGSTLTRLVFTGKNIARVVVDTPGDTQSVIDDIFISNDTPSFSQPDMVMQLRVNSLVAAVSTPDQPSVVVFTILVKNIGQGKAKNFRVDFPIDSNLEMLSAGFDAPKSWVSDLKPDKMKIEFGAFDPDPLGVVKATIRVSVKQNAALGTRITLRLKGFVGWDGGSNLETSSNAVSFTIGDTTTSDSNDGAIQPVSGTTSADKSSATASGDIFIPFERITIWINLPDGTVKGIGAGVALADQNGIVTFIYSLAGASPGSYSLVLLGERSGVQGVAAFIVT